MLAQFQQFVNNLKPLFSSPLRKGRGVWYWLLLANVALVFFLTILNNLKIIPLRTGDFIFFALLILALALYRPGWVFLFFIGTIPLENINLAPANFGISIRPYQFIGALIITALLIRWLTGKLNFELIKLKWYDWLVVAMSVSGFLSFINAPNKVISLKLAIIFTTFVALYFLVRNYIQNLEDLKKIVPFFLSSSFIVVLYGIWQNIWFLRGLTSFETMPGRPNATFTEADWLGIFIILVVAVLYILIYKCHSERSVAESKNLLNNKQEVLLSRSFVSLRMTVLFIFLILSYTILILTVSRSAWLGAFAVTFIFLFTIFTNLKLNYKKWQWKKTIQIKLVIISALIIAIGVVYLFHLTNFQLFNRIESTGSGMQEITISCKNNINLPEKINNIAELEKYNCRHINLEEINFEKSIGNYVAEIYRQDPNVSIRSEIYQKSWEQIKNHWILGIGWGSIGQILGQDSRGANFNSSNIFLEIWLGSGILGFASFLAIITYILLRAIKNYYSSQDNLIRMTSLFLIISCLAIVIPNFFNAGIFLGFLWVWFAIAQIDYQKQ